MEKPVFRTLFKHPMKIIFTDNACIYVEAGCCKLSFSSAADFLAMLTNALANPVAFEKEYFRYVKQLPQAAEEVRRPTADPDLGCGR